MALVNSGIEKVRAFELPGGIWSDLWMNLAMVGQSQIFCAWCKIPDSADNLGLTINR